MLALGIILVLVAAAVLIAALFGGSGSGEPAGFDLGAVNVETNTFGVFLAGAVTLLLLVAGLALISAGMRRARRRRQEKKELNRLSQKLEAHEARSTTEPAGTTTGGGSTTGAADATTAETRTDSTVTDPNHPSR